MKPTATVPSRPFLQSALLVLLVMTLVCLPFAVFGEDFVLPLLHTREQQAGALMLVSIGLLASDSVAPVPSTLVIMYLAHRAGWVAGMVGGTIGMSAGVLAAAWLGRYAVGRLAPRFIPEAELSRLRAALQDRLALTLACLRSVPVLAETSVIVAAASGISTGKIVRATLLPNLVISAIYSVAADDSAITAALTFGVLLALSFVLWRRSVAVRTTATVSNGNP